MNLHVLSDLHVEFGDFTVPDVGADLIVLAGDTHVGMRGLRWVIDQDLTVPALYVLGNHEFYRDKFPGLIDKMITVVFPEPGPPVNTIKLFKQASFRARLGRRRRPERGLHLRQWSSAELPPE
jgi:hypothetical protein